MSLFWKYLTLLLEIRWDDILDISFAAILLGTAIYFLRTSRTRGVSLAFLFFGGFFLTATQLELKLTTWMLQGIAAVIVLVVVIVYQNDIRRLFEQLPAKILLNNMHKGEFQAGVAALLSETLKQLSANEQGALIILPGRDPVTRFITGGTPLDGRLSKALILSIFDPNSPGHDGAAIVKGDRVELFGTRLPLSEQEEPLRERGTRHAAALGLAEKTDALVLVVSEESARVSVARDGQLKTLKSLENLDALIDEFLRETAGEKQKTGMLKSAWRGLGFDALSAIAIAIILWLMLVPGTVVESVSYDIPIEIQNTPEGYSLTEVLPAKVAVTLSGERRHLFQINPKELEIPLDATLTRFGRQTFPITKAHLLLPPKIDIAEIQPEEVRVLVKKTD